MPHYLFTPGVPLHSPILLSGFIYVFNYFCLFYPRTEVAAGPVGYPKLFAVPCCCSIYTLISADGWRLPAVVCFSAVSSFVCPATEHSWVIVVWLSARTASVKYRPLKVVVMARPAIGACSMCIVCVFALKRLVDSNASMCLLFPRQLRLILNVLSLQEFITYIHRYKNNIQTFLKIISVTHIVAKVLLQNQFWLQLAKEKP